MGGVPERHVVIVAYHGLQPLDAVGPYEVFAGAGRAAAALGPGRRLPRHSRLARWRCGAGRERPRAGHVAPARGPGAHRHPGAPRRVGRRGGPSDEAAADWISQAAPRCRRVATVCTGAFLAAEAGLLDGRRVTTHWARARQLADEYPGLPVDADPIYIRDGKYWSSAGSPPASTWRWRWSRRTSASTWPRRSPAGW